MAANLNPIRFGGERKVYLAAAHFRYPRIDNNSKLVRAVIGDGLGSFYDSRDDADSENEWIIQIYKQYNVDNNKQKLPSNGAEKIHLFDQSVDNRNPMDSKQRQSIYKIQSVRQIVYLKRSIHATSTLIDPVNKKTDHDDMHKNPSPHRQTDHHNLSRGNMQPNKIAAWTSTSNEILNVRTIDHDICYKLKQLPIHDLISDGDKTSPETPEPVSSVIYVNGRSRTTTPSASIVANRASSRAASHASSHASSHKSSRCPTELAFQTILSRPSGACQEEQRSSKRFRKMNRKLRGMMIQQYKIPHPSRQTPVNS